MLPWLLCASAPLPPAAFLSPAEAARYASLKTEKRKKDWLLGRWCAKNLFAAHLRETVGEIPLNIIEIRNAPSGAPYGTWEGKELPPLTISHGHGYAFCALHPWARGMGPEFGVIGADLEKVEPRSPLFVEDYFTPDEQAQVAATAPAWRDTLVTAIWSAKEAALKVVQLGLTVDTRGVECRIPPVTAPPEGWAEFVIEWNPKHLPRLFPPLTGWWRVWEGLVLTMAVANNLASRSSPEWTKF